jgi:pyruvate/oxaloacetate carboxyltransferase
MGDGNPHQGGGRRRSQDFVPVAQKNEQVGSQALEMTGDFQ